MDYDSVIKPSRVEMKNQERNIKSQRDQFDASIDHHDEYLGKLHRRKSMDYKYQEHCFHDGLRIIGIFIIIILIICIICAFFYTCSLFKVNIVQFSNFYKNKYVIRDIFNCETPDDKNFIYIVKTLEIPKHRLGNYMKMYTFNVDGVYLNIIVGTRFIVRHVKSDYLEIEDFISKQCFKIVGSIQNYQYLDAIIVPIYENYLIVKECLHLQCQETVPMHRCSAKKYTIIN